MELGNNSRNTNRDNNNIIIWQQNVNKSRTCQHDLISSTRLIEKQVDVIALQEPAISDFVVTIASKDWRVIYPSTHAKDLVMGTGNPWVFLGVPVPIPAKTPTRGNG